MKHNLIGISGKIGSGKDTVGRIIQYLSTNPSGKPNRYSITFEAFCNKNYSTQRKECKWEIKKFADKLKDIVCLLIGCTREQLEDREFKEKELEEEWWYYKGVKGTSNFKLLDKIDYNNLKTNQKGWYELYKLTPRKLLQLLGTEAGRQIIHPNIWVNALFVDYKVEKMDFVFGAIYPNWIITDVRFPNEIQAIKDRGGIVIRVNRPNITASNGIKVYTSSDSFLDSNLHSSETALDNYKDWNYIVDNNSTIKDLISQIKNILYV